MESVWWVFKTLVEKGLVYRGYKVMPYSTACATPLSNFEAGLNYKDVADPAVVVSFPLKDDPEVCDQTAGEKPSAEFLPRSFFVPYPFAVSSEGSVFFSRWRLLACCSQQSIPAPQNAFFYHFIYYRCRWELMTLCQTFVARME